jgi:hypothetical protein
MRRLLAGIAAIAVVSIAPANAAELTMAPVQKAPRPVPARLGQFSGSVVDPLGKGGSDMLETESKFKKRTSAKRAGGEPDWFQAIMRGTITN